MCVLDVDEAGGVGPEEEQRDGEARHDGHDGQEDPAAHHRHPRDGLLPQPHLPPQAFSWLR